MAQRVVDRLEPVQVDHEDPEGLVVPAATAEGVLHVAVGGAAVPDTGERVGDGLALERAAEAQVGERHAHLPGNVLGPARGLAFAAAQQVDPGGEHGDGAVAVGERHAQVAAAAAAEVPAPSGLAGAGEVGVAGAQRPAVLGADRHVEVVLVRVARAAEGDGKDVEGLGAKDVRHVGPDHLECVAQRGGGHDVLGSLGEQAEFALPVP